MFRHRTTTLKKSIKPSASAVTVTPRAPKGARPSTTDNVSSDVGSDLLGFGASVEFHEDHRRHIHAEIQEIEASNKAKKEAVARETKSEEHLQKDLGHAKSELGLLTQGSEDQLESAKTFLTLTKNLDKELRSNIIEPTTLSSASAAPVSPTETKLPPAVSVSPDGENQGNDSKEPESSSSTPPSSDCEKTSRILLNQEILVQKASRADDLLQTLQNETKSLEEIEAEIRELGEKKIQLEESMEFQGLQESLERAQEDERRLQSELQQDRDTKATRVTEIQQIRESCGTKAQQFTDLVRSIGIHLIVKKQRDLFSFIFF